MIINFLCEVSLLLTGSCAENLTRSLVPAFIFSLANSSNAFEYVKI